MRKQTILIRVDKIDLDKLMSTGLKIFLEQNPEFKDFRTPTTFMFKRAVKSYCGEI